MTASKLTFLAATSLAICVAALTPPDYQKALADLRYSKHLLELPGDYHVVADQKRALERLERAIHDIEAAAIRDHKNPNWKVPDDVPRIRSDRFQKARIGVDAAIRNMQQWTPDPAAGWRTRALQDLNDTLRFIDAAMKDAAATKPPSNKAPF